MNTQEPIDVGFKPANPFLKIERKESGIRVKIVCILCGKSQGYNVNDKNEIELYPCDCLIEKERDRFLLEVMPEILKKFNQDKEKKRAKK